MLKPNAIEALRHARLSQNLTVRALKDLTGISAATIVRVEKGQHIPTDRTVYRWAKAVGLDPQDLVDNSPDNQEAAS